jgi:hypothetical protein
MKKIVLGLFVFSLLLVNVPFVFGQEATNKFQEVDGFETKDVYQKRLDPISQDILWVAQKFGVNQDWIHNEMEKGYVLVHIYEGLLEQQQGGSYELFMQQFSSHEVKIRNKRAAKRSSPIGKPNRKKQGREMNEKKKKDEKNDKKWKSNSNKNPNRETKKHTPSKKHKGGKS